MAKRKSENEISHDPKVRALEHFKIVRQGLASATHSIRFGIKELSGKGPEREAAHTILESLDGPWRALWRLIEKMEKANGK
jgi:hypothetical protein